MAVDWVADQTPDPIIISPGSAARFTFLKLKEGVGGEDVKNEVFGVIKGIKEKFGGIQQITCGENFSNRAKGFSIASIAVFKGVKEMEEADSNEELVNLEKEKIRDYLEGVVVVDYVVPSPPSSSL